MKFRSIFISSALATALSCSQTQAALVATLPTDVSTTNTGQAVYELPFDIPAGTGGIQPELGISYRSGSGKGVMGTGFSISGLSSITRVPTALDPDGFIDGVDLDANDQFSMDGKRLICIAGTHNTDGAEYRTEIDTFAKITAHDVAGQQGVGYFEVQTKNGLTMWYGEANNSAFGLTYTPPSGSAVTGHIIYNLSKVQDSLGNKIEYFYTIDAENQQLLSRIDYSFANGNPTYQINFAYKAAPFAESSYTLGTKITKDQILDYISCSYVGNATPLWKYVMQYKSQSKKSLLQLESIQQYAMGVAAGSVSLGWEQDIPEADFGWDPVAGRDAPFTLVGTQVNVGSYRNHEFVDLNGDGFVDVLAYGHAASGATSSYLNTGSGWQASSGYTPAYALRETHPNLPYYRNFKLIDLDGDGLVDLQGFGHATAPASLSYLNDGTQWVTAPNYDAPFLLLETHHVTSGVLRNHEFIDLNGDGLIDLQAYGVGSSPSTSYINDGSGWQQASGYNPPFILTENKASSAIRRNHTFVDLDADGLPDLIAYSPTSGAIATYINTGTLWEKTTTLNAPFNLSETHPTIAPAFGGLSNHRFIDLNGDGRVDLQALSSASGNTGSYLNTPTGWVRAANFDAPFALDETHPKFASRRNHEFIDLNGDGLLDIQAYGFSFGGTTQPSTSYVNSGSAWVRAAGYDAPFALTEAHPQNASFARNHEFIDLNSDGLPDLMSYNTASGSIGSYMNTGSGWSRASNFDPPSVLKETHGATQGSARNHSLIDLNGDGLLDIQGFDLYGVFNLDSYVNNGTTWVRASEYDAPFVLFKAHPGVGTLENHGVTDLTGDGIEDLIAYVPAGAQDRGFYQNRSRTGRLVSVANNFGNETRIEFGTTGDISIYQRGLGAVYPIVDVIDPTVVVKSISKDTGLDDSSGDPIFYTTEYTYAEARFHRHGRGFLGYRVFESYDTETTLSKTEILAQDFPWVGMPLSVETRGPNGQLLSRTVNALNAKMLNEYLDGGITKYHTLFPYYNNSQEWAAEYDPNVTFTSEVGRVAHLEANAHSHTLAENEFDSHGNNIEIAVFYDADNARTPNDNGTPGDPSDDFSDYGSQNYQITTNWFEQDDESEWFLGRLTKSVVQSAVPHASGTGLDEQTRTSSYVYSTTSGHLMEEVIEPGHPTLELRTVYTRDSSGNIESQTQHPAGLATRTVLTHSDLDATGRFFETSTNALGHSRGTSYYPELGLPSTVTGINGREIDYYYDDLGRPNRVVRPDATETTRTYALDSSVTVDCEPGNPSSSVIQSVYKVTTEATEQATTVVWHDRLGRAIRSQSESFDGSLVNVDSLFNEVGLATCVSLPYFSTASPQYWTENRYDLMGRVEEREAADGTIEKMVYDGLVTTTIKNYAPGGTANNQNQTQVTTKNVRGQVVSETTFDDADSPLVLSYGFDAFGSLVRTTDPENNVIAMRYDIRGNRTGMDDPDMGIDGTVDDDDWGWTYAFDALGRLTEQTDARDQVTHYQYDALDRKIAETWNYGTPQAKTANWYYDGSTWHDELGQLRLEVSPDGHRSSYYYDDLGRPFLTLRKIDDQYYYSTVVYDDYSRPDVVSEYWRPNALRDLPEQHHLAWKSFGLKYTYNPRGLLENITDAQGHTWWDNPEFDENGQLLSYDLGNGLSSRMAYHPSRRTITDIETGPGLSSTIQNLSFAHDQIGNLTSRSDAHSDSGSGRTENLTYDRLNRIKTTVVAGLPTLSVKYDGLGNIENRDRLKPDGTATNMVYTYGSSRPHAVTNVTNSGRSSAAYGYDANGSIIARADSGQNIFWNGFNKPDFIAADTYTTTFSYGASRNRVYSVTKENSVNTRRQLYAGSLEQEETWDATLDGGNGDWALQRTRVYISTPAGTIGTWIEELTPNPLGGDPTSGEPVEPTLTRTRNYLHKDHLGSITAITDVNGALVERTSFDVWGNQRDPDTWLPLDEATVAAQAEATSAITDRGYTGHEQLDELGLIHMNGRIYDPVIARMLSADPTVPDPSDLQAFNRYSYVLNNPLRYTDPSGFSSEDDDDDKNEEIEESSEGDDLSESIESVAIHEGEEVEGIPIRDSGIEIKDETYSDGNTSYKTREVSINGSVVSKEFSFRTEGENGEEYFAHGIEHIGLAQLGDTGTSFANKLADNHIDTSGLYGLDDIHGGEYTGQPLFGTNGILGNDGFVSGSGTESFQQTNSGGGGFFGISLRDAGEFAAGFVPYGGAVVALAKGDFRGAAIEAAVETAIIGVGAMTGGAGYAALKTARSAKKVARATNKLPIWSPGKTGNAVENAFGHFKKHGNEFPEFQNAKQYAEGAKKFFSDPPSGALTKTRANGDKLFYDPPTNTFGVQAADGAPKTMFRPDKGMDYWNKQ